jgi:phenol hydroxylase P4 protein
MSVNAIGEYRATPRDLQANFNGMQMLYVHWEKHLIFCSPFAFLVAPAMTFAEFVEQLLKDAIKTHPDSARVDFNEVVWNLNGERFVPDYASSLEANGIDHKSMLRLNTPGLNGVLGSCS